MRLYTPFFQVLPRRGSGKLRYAFTTLPRTAGLAPSRRKVYHTENSYLQNFNIFQLRIFRVLFGLKWISAQCGGGGEIWKITDNLMQLEPKFMRTKPWEDLDETYHWWKFRTNWSTQRGGNGVQSFIFKMSYLWNRWGYGLQILVKSLCH